MSRVAHRRQPFYDVSVERHQIAALEALALPDSGPNGSERYVST